MFGETHFGAKTAPYCRGRMRVYWILKYSKVLYYLTGYLVPMLHPNLKATLLIKKQFVRVEK